MLAVVKIIWTQLPSAKLKYIFRFVPVMGPIWLFSLTPLENCQIKFPRFPQFGGQQLHNAPDITWPVVTFVCLNPESRFYILGFITKTEEHYFGRPLFRKSVNPLLPITYNFVSFLSKVIGPLVLMKISKLKIWNMLDATIQPHVWVQWNYLI